MHRSSTSKIKNVPKKNAGIASLWILFSSSSSTVPLSSPCARLIKIFRETACLANGRTATFPALLATLDSMYEALNKHHQRDDILADFTAPVSEGFVAEYNSGSTEELGTRRYLMTSLNLFYK